LANLQHIMVSTKSLRHKTLMSELIGWLHLGSAITF